MSNDSPAIELVDVAEQVLRARLSGKSVRRIAGEHRLPIARVSEIIEKQLPTLDNNLRLRTLQLELERLDAMADAIYKSAVEDGDLQAIAVMLRLQERRSAYLALDHGLRTADPRPLQDTSTPPDRGSTQILIDMLDQIVAERPAAGLVTGTSEPVKQPAADDPPSDDPPAT